MYTSLLNVKQAIIVERQLIDNLETYIEHESQRLEDIKRWVTDRERCHDARVLDSLSLVYVVGLLIKV